MNRKKEKHRNKPLQASEPEAAYKPFVFFNSFEEMEEYEARECAALSYDERMEHVEQLRKMVFSEYLQDDGTWPPLSKKFKIMPPYTNETGK